MSQSIAIIDLGSNTTRLVAYEYEPGLRFHLTDEVREVVRLREGMGAAMVLRAVAIDRALRAMRMFEKLCQASGIEEVVLTATSAVRDAANGGSFLARLRSETGWEPRLLTGEEEGYYGALGAINGTGLRHGFVIDLGGGSVQIVEVRDGLPRRRISLPLGALRLSDLYLGFDRPQPVDVQALASSIREQLAQLDWFRAEPGDELVAIGGTIRTLAKVDQVATGFPLDTVHGYVLAADRLHTIADSLLQMTTRERSRVPGLDEARADIIQSGALVFDALMAHSGFASITISQQGLREGLFYEHFLAGQAEPVFENLREFSVLNLARNFECLNAHSEHVTFLSLRLFDQLQPAHQLDPGYRELLWAAGILHDIGVTIDFYYHHHHSFYIVLNSGLPGYSPAELALVALLARYHRKGNPKPGEYGTILSPADQEALLSLAAMLRLAEFLERGRSQVVRDVRCHLDLAGGWVQIEVLAEGDASMEIWDASRNTNLLESALGLEVELVAGVWLEPAAQDPTPAQPGPEALAEPA
jgi:exopolyphosphatase/guanosine-5'-triphosphate,3'-diphosphate pyrophosphatase